MSASNPTPIEPFFGYMPYIFAWLVEVSATNWLGVMRPSATPLLHRICRRVSTPGMPLGTQRNEVRAFAFLFPAGPRNRTGNDRRRKWRIRLVEFLPRW